MDDIVPGVMVMGVTATAAGVLLMVVAVLLLVPRAEDDPAQPPHLRFGLPRWSRREGQDKTPTPDPAALLDLSAALLVAGVGIEAALERLARTIPGAEPLAGVHRALAAGARWDQAWAGQRGGLAEFGEQCAFAHATGAPTAGLLQVSARQLRRERRHEAERRAAQLGVKMVLPLGICFLPAFILLGVIPVVLGLLPQVFSL